MRTKLNKLLSKLKSYATKIGTLNLVLMFMFAFFIWFNWQMLITYRMYGSIPESYACAVVAATIGECGICGWIRTTKDRRQERKWEKEDRAELSDEQSEEDCE